MSLADTAALVRVGRLDPVRHLGAHLGRISARNPMLHALAHVAEGAALRDAARLAAIVGRGGDPGALAGAVVAVKDVFDVAGQPTRANSRLFAGRPAAAADSAVAARLRAAGALLVGKATCWELSVGGPSCGSPDPPALNPWAAGADPGGSSSGSAVAVAGGLAQAAIGGDTGGSVRLPAAFCGLVGFKPSHGAVPMAGSIGFAASLDVAGPLAASAADCALLQAVLADAAPAPVPNLAGRVFGVPQALVEIGRPAPEMRAALAAACAALVGAGAVVRPVALASAELWNDCYFVVARAEAHAAWRATLARAAGALNPLTRRSLAFGALLPADAVAAAGRLRTQLRGALDKVLGGIDALLLPTTPDEAGDLDGPDAFSRPDSAPYTRPFSLAGVPAVSMPCGVGRRGRPLGLQLVGRRGADMGLLALACAVEQVVPGPGAAQEAAWWS